MRSRNVALKKGVDFRFDVREVASPGTGAFSKLNIEIKIKVVVENDARSNM